MKIIFTTTDGMKARQVVGYLDEAGIENCLLNENINNIMPYASVISEMQIKIAVADEDSETAAKLVAELGFDESSISVCPLCGSKDITLGIQGVNKIKKTFLLIVSLITLSPLGHIKYNYYCNNCKKEF